MDNLQGGTLALDHQYHLHQRLGAIGLVTAYRGTQDPFDLPIEVTVYDGLADAGADPAITDQVEDAARRAAAVQHPGIARVVDFGEVDLGIPFVIEKIQPGQSLADLMETRGVFAPNQVLTLVKRLADILQAAHDRELYHGQLKPQWIDVDGDDLNSARLRHTGLALSMAQLVAMPNLVLTTEYVDAFPPECFDVAARDDAAANPQRSPAHLSAAADQWGLACLAYRLLVGVHPFFDDPVDASDGLIRIKTDDPPSLEDLGIDGDIADVVGRALSPQPRDRYPSIEAFAAALSRAMDDDPEASKRSEHDDGPTEASFDAPRAPSPTAEAAPSMADAPPVDPRPSGLLLTLAIALVLISNIAWFFVSLDADRDDAPDDPSAAADAPDHDQPPGILPTGLEIASEPSEVEIFIDDNGTERSLGYTPYTISDLLQDQPSVELFLRRDGYFEQTLRIDDQDGQRDRFQVQMIPTPDED